MAIGGRKRKKPQQSQAQERVSVSLPFFPIKTDFFFSLIALLSQTANTDVFISTAEVFGSTAIFLIFLVFISNR